MIVTQAQGSRCSILRLRTSSHSASPQPHQTVIPNGRPIPHRTMFLPEKSRGARLVHWWLGG